MRFPEVYPRAAYLIDHMGGHHLHVVIYDFDRSGCCLLAPLSSVKVGKYYDPACVLNNIDHDWCRHLTYVVYDQLAEPRCEHTARMIRANLYTVKDPVEEGVFKRIVNGLFTSENTRDRIIKEAKKLGLRYIP